MAAVVFLVSLCTIILVCRILIIILDRSSYGPPARMMPVKHTDGGRLASGLGRSRNDCGVRALTVASGAPYLEVYKIVSDLCKKFGGSHPDKGISVPILIAAAVQLGAIEQRYPERMRLNKEEFPQRGRFVVVTRGHAVAVVNGTVWDLGDPQENGRKQVKAYYRFPDRA